MAEVERARLQTRAARFGGRVFGQGRPLVLRLVVADDVRLALQAQKQGRLPMAVGDPPVVVQAICRALAIGLVVHARGM